MTRKQAPRVSAVDIGIRRIVREQPGIHFRGLGRAANVSSAGQLRHHLDRLARLGVLVEVQDGRYKRFFVAGAHDPKLRPEMARFARPVPRRIAQLLLESPMNRTELRRSLGCADSTLGYHLSRMVLLGDLAKERGQNCCRYSLTSEDLVRKMLLMHGPPDGLHRPDGTPDDNLPNPLRPRPHDPGDMPFPRRAPIREAPEPLEGIEGRYTPSRPKTLDGSQPGIDLPTLARERQLERASQRQQDFARGATTDAPPRDAGDAGHEEIPSGTAVDGQTAFRNGPAGDDQDGSYYGNAAGQEDGSLAPHHFAPGQGDNEHVDRVGDLDADYSPFGSGEARGNADAGDDLDTRDDLDARHDIDARDNHDVRDGRDAMDDLGASDDGQGSGGSHGEDAHGTQGGDDPAR